MSKLSIYQGDNLSILKTFPDQSFNLIYIDPPFNTGHTQKRTRIQTKSSSEGGRVGYGGKHYEVIKSESSSSYSDQFDDFLGFLEPRLKEAYRLLSLTGSFFFHIDYREVHYCKVLLDKIFGRDNFINEIIWSYDFGARSKTKWSTKHDNILWYAKDKEQYVFNYDQIDRIPYLAPALVGDEKAARGKHPTDVWWNTIVPTNGAEKTGYPTQKPRGILDRIVLVHSNENDRLLDFFAGSGSFGESALVHNRSCILIDQNPEAIAVMEKRLGKYKPKVVKVEQSAG